MGSFIFRLITLPLYLLFGFNTPRKPSEPTLLLVDYKLPDEEDAATVFELTARRTGFISWILQKLGILSRYKILITQSDVSVTVGSMKGAQTFVAPLSRINAVGLKLQKPVGAAYVGVACLLLALFNLLRSSGQSGARGSFFNPFQSGFDPRFFLEYISYIFALLTSGGVILSVVLIVVGVIFLLRYWLVKRLSIGFTTSDLQDHVGIKFRTSSIAGKDINFDTLYSAVDRVTDAMLAARYEHPN
ncbi:MAG: hypothetical protein SF123_02085 [Chloroflexota bacterium]|nr:hypothetical protein [Chloroflexota bacterium]